MNGLVHEIYFFTSTTAYTRISDGFLKCPRTGKGQCMIVVAMSIRDGIEKMILKATTYIFATQKVKAHDSLIRHLTRSFLDVYYCDRPLRGRSMHFSLSFSPFLTPS